MGKGNKNMFENSNLGKFPLRNQDVCGFSKPSVGECNKFPVKIVKHCSHPGDLKIAIESALLCLGNEN